MADLTPDIETNAGNPKKAEVDGTSAEQHSLPDQIAADRYLKASAAAKRGLGIRHVKLVPPGAADVDRCR